MTDPSKLRRDFGPLGTERFQSSEGDNLFADRSSNNSNDSMDDGQPTGSDNDPSSKFSVTGSINDRALVFRDGDFVSTGRSPTLRLSILSGLGLATGIGLIVITALLGFRVPSITVLSSAIPASFMMPSLIMAKRELDMIRFGVREKSGLMAVRTSYWMSIVTLIIIVACCGWSIASVFQ